MLTQTHTVVILDLKAESFTPGKKNYDRVRASLGERFEQTFDVILAWHPPEEQICPSSIAAWFHEHGYNVSLCQQTALQRTEYSVRIPAVSKDCDTEKLFEWLGVLGISGDLRNEEEENFVNTYVCPSPFIEVGQVQYLQWTGFFTARQIERVYGLLKEYMFDSGQLPWLALHVQGFSDSPVSFDLKEHKFLADGDNSYTIVFDTDGDIIVRKSLSSNNKPRAYQ